MSSAAAFHSMATSEPGTSVERVGERYTTVERESIRLRFAPGAKVLVLDHGAWTKGEVQETWIRTCAVNDAGVSEDTWSAYAVNVNRKSTPVARDTDDFIRRFVTTVDHGFISAAEQNVNRMAEEQLDAEEAHAEADGGGASAVADAPVIAPTFSPGDSVWANIDGHDISEANFVPRPMVVLGTPDDGATYELAHAYDPALSADMAQRDGKASILLRAYESMERTLPAFPADKVTPPELTWRGVRPYDDIRKRNDRSFEDHVRDNLYDFFRETTIPSAAVPPLSVDGMSDEFTRVAIMTSTMSMYSECCPHCDAMRFRSLSDSTQHTARVVMDEDEIGELVEYELPDWKWHAPDPGEQHVYEQQVRSLSYRCR